MPNPVVYAPWRMQYIRSLDPSSTAAQGCFLCQAVAANTDELRRQHLVLWNTDQSVVMMNLFPYNNGHLLVAPRAHKGELEELSDAETLDLQKQTDQAVRLLRRAVSAQGFNIGINLGRCAGAGLPDHLHQHVVPRWGGDTNFMCVVGEIRVIPQAVSELYDELMRVRASLSS